MSYCTRYNIILRSLYFFRSFRNLTPLVCFALPTWGGGECGVAFSFCCVPLLEGSIYFFTSTFRPFDPDVAKIHNQPPEVMPKSKPQGLMNNHSPWQMALNRGSREPEKRRIRSRGRPIQNLFVSVESPRQHKTRGHRGRGHPLVRDFRR